MLAYLFQPKRLNLLTKVSYPKNFHTYLIRLIVLSSREMHLQYKLKNLKRTCLKFLKKNSQKTMLGCTFKCKPIKIHKNSSSMSGVGCSFVVPIVLFYKSILLLGGHVSRYLVSRLFHMFPCVTLPGVGM